MNTVTKAVKTIELSERMQDFVQQLDSSFVFGPDQHDNLGIQLIGQIGGENCFIYNHESIATGSANDGYSGLYKYEDILDFYHTHKHILMSYADAVSDKTSFDNGTDLIVGHLISYGYSEDEIYDFLDADEPVTTRQCAYDVCGFLIWNAMEALSKDYMQFAQKA